MLAAAPSIAVAQSTAPAAKLSVAHARAGATAKGSDMEGGSGAYIAIALLVGIAAIGVLALVNNDDEPASA